MYNHAPDGYQCPFCLLVQGIENEYVKSRQDDIVYKDNFITTFIASHWWPQNKGHVLIIPNEHIENIYTLPIHLSNRIHALEIEIAKAFKEVYKCDGVSSRQHNEPHGSQDVWHYHLHIYPRYAKDNLYTSVRELSKPESRIEYADKIKDYLAKKLKLDQLNKERGDCNDYVWWEKVSTEQ